MNLNNNATTNEENNYKPNDNINWEKEIREFKVSNFLKGTPFNTNKNNKPSKGGKRKSRTQRSKIEKRKTRRRR